MRGHLTNADLQRSMEAEKQVMQQLRNVKANPTSLANVQLGVKSISAERYEATLRRIRIFSFCDGSFFCTLPPCHTELSHSQILESF